MAKIFIVQERRNTGPCNPIVIVAKDRNEMAEILVNHCQMDSQNSPRISDYSVIVTTGYPYPGGYDTVFIFWESDLPERGSMPLSKGRGVFELISPKEFFEELVLPGEEITPPSEDNSPGW